MKVWGKIQTGDTIDKHKWVRIYSNKANDSSMHRLPIDRSEIAMATHKSPWDCRTLPYSTFNSVWSSADVNVSSDGASSV